MPERKPNFILVMADDLGYGDVRCFGGDTLETPHIDAIGARGLTFSDFHANGPVCSPTRAALITGRYQQRSGLEGVIYVRGETRQVGLHPDEYSLAHAFKESGYTTGLFGKWHLGYKTDYNPTHHGFDEFRGYVSGNVDYHSHVDNSGVADWWNGLELEPEEGYVTDLVSRHACDFIERHKEEPFLLYVAHEAPHWPYQGRRDKADRAVGGQSGVDFESHGSRQDRKAAYKEMIEAMDEGIGWIVEKLKEHGLEDDTLILFCSDNGPCLDVGSAGVLRAGKGSVYEGGHRVPACACWPGRIAPGTTTDETVLTMDLLPTFLGLAECAPALPHPTDGVNLSGVFLRQESPPDRNTYWRYDGKAAVRQGRWKLVRDGETVELYDLDADLGESNDIGGDHAQIRDSLHRALEAWEAEVLRDVELKTV